MVSFRLWPVLHFRVSIATDKRENSIDSTYQSVCVCVYVGREISNRKRAGWKTRGCISRMCGKAFSLRRPFAGKLSWKSYHVAIRWNENGNAVAFIPSHRLRAQLPNDVYIYIYKNYFHLRRGSSLLSVIVIRFDGSIWNVLCFYWKIPVENYHYAGIVSKMHDFVIDI